MHGLAVYVKKGLSFAHDLSIENWWEFLIMLSAALLHLVFYILFLYQSPTFCLCKMFDAVLSNIEEILSVNPSAKAFVFWDLMLTVRTCWIILVELTDMVSGYLFSFLSQTTLLRLSIFLLRSISVILTGQHFWISFSLLTVLFVLHSSILGKSWSFCCFSFS